MLGERLKEAMQKLKKMPGGKRGRRRLYELPWYMFIGPPGAGKTTALVNSGLNFPLAEGKGPAALRGVGGTRDCEWWFTDQAVLIDTAGRYTTQDSQATVDAAGWLGFLRLLKKHRRRQPLNGALLAIGLSDLAALSEPERLAHAAAMRKRMRELHDELGVRVPVYVLFTKTDLIAGFVEFFDNLGKEEREQVWGMTLPLDETAEGARGRRRHRPVLRRVRPAAGPAQRPHAGTGEPGNRYRPPPADLWLSPADRLDARHRLGIPHRDLPPQPAGGAARCCAACISPPAPRTARRSTGCSARWPASSACSANPWPPSAAPGAAISSPG